jgi:hypothetical protein
MTNLMSTDAAVAHVLAPGAHRHDRRRRESSYQLDLVETLAAELHRQYRAAEKSMNRGSGNRLLHDHGWSSCSKQRYFRKRAELIIARSTCKDPRTLGEAEEALQAEVLRRRLIVAGKTCALEECDEVFLSSDPRKLYCCQYHAHLAGVRRLRAALKGGQA